MRYLQSIFCLISLPQLQSITHRYSRRPDSPEPIPLLNCLRVQFLGTNPTHGQPHNLQSCKKATLVRLNE